MMNKTPYMDKSKIAADASDNLSKKTGHKWSWELNNGHYVLQTEVILEFEDRLDAEREFSKKLNGIEFNIEIDSTKRVAQSRGLKSKVFATISHQGEINEISKNKFTYPKITDCELKLAKNILILQTRFNWKIIEYFYSLKNVCNHFQFNTIVDADTWEEADKKVQDFLDKSISGINIDTIATKRGMTCGKVNVTGRLENPIDIHQLINTFRKNSNLNNIVPVIHPGVSTTIGATIASALPNGISRDDAKSLKGIANISVSNSGMTLRFIDCNYAKKVSIALQLAGINSVSFKSEDVTNKFGTYRGTVSISDHAEVAKFIEDILKLSSDFTRDLYSRLSESTTLKF